MLCAFFKCVPLGGDFPWGPLCCSTKTGVGLMKKGKTKEALDCFNRALQVDAENEETLVAKGAL